MFESLVRTSTDSMPSPTSFVFAKAAFYSSSISPSSLPECTAGSSLTGSAAMLDGGFEDEDAFSATGVRSLLVRCGGC